MWIQSQREAKEAVCNTRWNDDSSEPYMNRSKFGCSLRSLVDSMVHVPKDELSDHSGYDDETKDLMN